MSKPSLIAVTALLGLAVLDLGPRARAGLILANEPAAFRGMADDADGSSDRDRAWPPAPHKDRKYVLFTELGPQNRGAGTSQSSSHPSGGQVALSASAVVCTPLPVTRFWDIPLFFVPSSCLFSVFEPPRSS